MNPSLNPSEQFYQLTREAWDLRLKHDPVFATTVGDHRCNDRLPSAREQDFIGYESTLRDILTRLAAVDWSVLAPDDRLNYDFFERDLQIQLGDLAFRAYLIPLTKSSGLPVYLPDVVDVTPFKTNGDYVSYLHRLTAFEGYANDLIALMGAGADRGYLPARAALAGVVEGLRMHAAVKEDPGALETSPFYRPFLNFPGHFSEEEKICLAEAGKAVICGPLAAGYRNLANFLETEYLPLTQENGATPLMPGRKAYYEFCVRRFTSLDISPLEVHQIGLSEVARISVEMEEVMRSVGFSGTLRQFSDHLRADPRFFVDTPAELMKEVAWLMKQVEGKLPGLFKVLPRTPFGLKETPAYLAPTSTSGYYFLPAGDGSTAGFYYVNTYDLKSRPLYEYEALSLHEAVPGHHLQLALQLEMLNVPEFRKWGETTAFIEGWALYAERLGLEMGFYRDAYTNFGRLVFEMWRAARLVVDTGLHYQDWPRQQAIDYLADNTALSLLNIANEVDRYISWPGQALAYKIGELEIRALRRKAEEALKGRFDIREFHYALLKNGGIPLTALRAQIDAWISEQSGSHT